MTQTIGSAEMTQIRAFCRKAYCFTGVNFNEADIDDAAQAAAARIVGYAAEKYDANKSAWRTFVSTVAYRHTLDRIEATRFHVSLNNPGKDDDGAREMIDTMQDSDPDPERRLMARERLMQLRAALETLSETDRYIVTTLCEDASEEACAPVMVRTGLSLSAVRVRLCRARKALAESMA